jgi:hypothetical protein
MKNILFLQEVCNYYYFIFLGLNDEHDLYSVHTSEFEKMIILESIINHFPGRKDGSVDWNQVMDFIGNNPGWQQNQLKKMHTFWLAVTKNKLGEHIRSLYNQYGDSIHWAIFHYDFKEFRDASTEVNYLLINLLGYEDSS